LVAVLFHQSVHRFSVFSLRLLTGASLFFLPGRCSPMLLRTGIWGRKFSCLFLLDRCCAMRLCYATGLLLSRLLFSGWP
jgi:hypothetical protein